MPVPDYQTLMLPLLEIVARNQQEFSIISDVRNEIAKIFKLTEDDIDLRVPSGKQRLIDNRVGWARTYLVKAGLLESPARAQVRVTEAGLAALASKPEQINLKFLRSYPSFNDFHGPNRIPGRLKSGAQAAVIPPPQLAEDDTRTPEERINDSVAEYNGSLADELFERLRSGTPAFFEEVVVQLLLAMNYGGGLAEAGQVLGRSGDGGVDGVIKEDRLGLDAVYVQAKLYRDPANKIDRKEIQAFVGALSGRKVRKGVFITLSKYAKSAHEYIREVDYRIALIDGEQLVQLMIEHDVGVTLKQTVKLKKIDEEFF